MPHSIFGWSYPPGCSGPPEGPLDRVCTCGDFESDHEENGKCGDENCECVSFTPQPMEPDPDPDPNEFAPPRADFSALSSAISRALTDASRWNEQLDLSGCDGENAYDTLTRVLSNGLREVEELRNHKHVDNEDGFCSICGRDGNA